MKKRILLPTSFFSSLLFTIFLFGFMIGLFFLPIILTNDRKSNSEHKTVLENREEDIVEAEVIDGDTLAINVTEELGKKLERFGKIDGDDPDYWKKSNYKDNKKNNIQMIKYYKKGSRISVKIEGIDAPEDKEYSPEENFYATEAKKFVTDKINNKRIKIEWNNENTDYYDRLLAYVYTQDEKGNYNDKSLNELILEERYAEVDKRDKYKPSHPKEEEFQKLENQARKEQKGIWNYQENMKWQDNH